MKGLQYDEVRKRLRVYWADHPYERVLE